MIARLRPTSKACSSVIEMRPLPRSSTKNPRPSPGCRRRSPSHVASPADWWRRSRRAQRIQNLPCEETCSCPRLVVERRTLDQIVHVAGVHEIRLFEKLVIGAFLPLLACEPPITLRRLREAGTDGAVHPQRTHLLQIILLDRRELGVAREVRCAAARQQAGRKLLHHCLAGLRKACQVLEAGS